MANDRGSNLGPLVIIGFMTASRRLRAAGGILGIVLLAIAGILWLATKEAVFVLFMLIGAAFVFYWVAATVLAWFVRVAEEDMKTDT
jgi:hypothetical protein